MGRFTCSQCRCSYYERRFVWEPESDEVDIAAADGKGKRQPRNKDLAIETAMKRCSPCLSPCRAEKISTTVGNTSYAGVATQGGGDCKALVTSNDRTPAPCTSNGSDPPLSPKLAQQILTITSNSSEAEVATESGVDREKSASSSDLPIATYTSAKNMADLSQHPAQQISTTMSSNPKAKLSIEGGAGQEKLATGGVPASGPCLSGATVCAPPQDSGDKSQELHPQRKGKNTKKEKTSKELSGAIPNYERQGCRGLSCSHKNRANIGPKWTQSMRCCIRVMF